eukprot:TRINITY_DN3106_c0_g1_i1.p1 TRINITY_DN3106_c0_g1~~TRINITY_DN3106_c0_g1_i1.p1  ORF type:complete len:372 (+),score=49.19 TRINITY_DN3106_c0_g1_i1:431-1546(+)
MINQQNQGVLALVDKYHPLFCAGVISTVSLAHFSGGSSFSDKFLSLQYPLPNTSNALTFGRGLQDAYFVVFMMCTIALFRWAYRTFVLKPTARYLGFNRSTTNKWVDIGWVSVYFACMWSWGIYLFHGDDWFFNTKHFWIDYPHPLEYRNKLFYLVQLSFWLTNFGMFFLEMQRRDYWQFFSHHCVTIGLILGSYYYHFHRVGTAILLILDIGDVFYYHVKMLKYANQEKAATVGFGLFMLVWFVTRHVFYAGVLYSVWFEFPKYLGFGYNPTSGFNLSYPVYVSFSVGLVVLQALLIFWFVMIVRLAIKVLSGEAPTDETDPDEEDEIEDKKEEDLNLDSQGKEMKATNYNIDGANTSPQLSEKEKKKQN